MAKTPALTLVTLALVAVKLARPKAAVSASLTLTTKVMSLLVMAACVRSTTWLMRGATVSTPKLGKLPVVDPALPAKSAHAPSVQLTCPCATLAAGVKLAR